MKYRRKSDGRIFDIKLCLIEHSPSKGDEYFGYYWEEEYHIRLYEMKTVSELKLAKEFEPVEIREPKTYQVLPGDNIPRENINENMQLFNELINGEEEEK